MAKQAIWNNTVIAESERTVTVEGNAYFPSASLNMNYFSPSDHQTVCPWKGTASYFHVEVNGAVLEDAAWTYREPKEAASHIKNHVAFWKGVVVEEV